MGLHTIIIHVSFRVPETFVKDLAILAGILCLCIVILGILVYNYAGMYMIITSTMFSSFALTLGVLAIGSVLLIYLLFRAFWRHV